MGREIIEVILNAKKMEKILDGCGMGVSQKEETSGFKNAVAFFKEDDWVWKMFDHIKSCNNIEMIIRKTRFLQRSRMDPQA